MTEMLQASTNLSAVQQSDCYKSHRLKEATLTLRVACHTPTNYPIIHELQYCTTNAMRSRCKNECYVRQMKTRTSFTSKHDFPVTVLKEGVKAKDAI